MIVEYVKNKHGRRKGVMVAVLSPNSESPEYLVGWSLCNPEDKFDRDIGLKMAIGRAQRFPSKFDNLAEYMMDLDDSVSLKVVQYSFLRRHLPNSMEENLKNFLTRCDKYFKNSSRPELLKDY